MANGAIASELQFAIRRFAIRAILREETMAINFTVNGKAASTDAPPDTPLLWVIREGLKLTGTKFGCGTGLCGACMVHIDGKRAFSCQIQVSEGRRQVGDHDRRAVAGFLPSAAEGLARRARAAMRLLPVRPDHERGRPAQAEPKPTREEIVEHMSTNICRCGTYQRIVRAVERAAREA